MKKMKNLQHCGEMQKRFTEVIVIGNNRHVKIESKKKKK